MRAAIVSSFKGLRQSPVPHVLIVCGVLAGCGGDITPTMSDALHFTVAASGRAPFDSAPDSVAGNVYFLGSESGTFGLYHAPATAGAISAVLAGAPLVKPRSLSPSTDDSHIYVADQAGILSVQVSNGSVKTLAAGTKPAGVEVGIQRGADVIYFTGTDGDGKPALFETNDNAAMPTVIAKGDPLKSPDQIAVAENGDLYLTDTAGVKGQGRVIKVSGGVASEFLTGLSLGNPAGLALTLDGKTLVISAINATSGTDEVLIVDTGAKSVTPFNKGIEGNKDGGGVHRARKANVFSWADLSAGGSGRSYIIK